MKFIKVGDVIINIAAISTVSKRSVKGHPQIRVTMINPEEGNHSDGSTSERWDFDGEQGEAVWRWFCEHSGATVIA